MDNVMEVLKTYSAIKDEVTIHIKSANPFALITISCVTTWTVANLLHYHRDEIGLKKRMETTFYTLLKKIPYVRQKIDLELADVNQKLAEDAEYLSEPGPFISELPEEGILPTVLVEMADFYKNIKSCEKQSGGISDQISGAIFHTDTSIENSMYGTIFSNFAWSNPLWPKYFPGVRKMESEVVRICCNLMNGDENTCGTMSTGGTISILLACLAHRNRLMSRGCKYPEMVVPTSAHAAFFKAAQLFRIKVRKIPVDTKTFKVNLKKMNNAINSSTCMLVGSAPNFPFGTVDDVVSIGNMGIKYDIPVHVDACLGGFLLPFLDADILFDFRVPGVTSISADTHKYGLATKGSSVVLYRNKDYLHFQYFCDPDWQGGIYASSTMEGSRCGGNIALCWAALLFNGRNQYVENAKKIVETTQRIRDGLAQIPGIVINGAGDLCVVSWKTKNEEHFSTYMHEMDKRGWHLGNLQFPQGTHIMVTLKHTNDQIINKLIQDSEDIMKKLIAKEILPTTENNKYVIYGTAQGLSDRSIVKEFAHSFLDIIASFTPPRERRAQAE